MKTNLFSGQPNKSYYFNSIEDFILDNPKIVLGKLTSESSSKGFDTSTEQNDAWENQINLLQNKLRIAKAQGNIIFEYDIVRMGKRIDVILLIKHMVFSLEFKNGAKSFVTKDAEQAEDYALDLKNFHKESEDLYVCPILIATDAKEKIINTIDSYKDKQIYLQYANNDNLMDCVEDVYNKYGEEKEIDFNKWYNSEYCPTPTIIEAAISAYCDHTVKAIAKSEAGQEGIDKCENEINKIIEITKGNNGKSIIFVTGVPGAGKTLVGLDLTAKTMDVDNSNYSVYLSGNGPLVSVLRKALVINAVERIKKNDGAKFDKDKSRKIKASVEAFIQEAYKFRKEYAFNRNMIPSENIIIFDEAQRCWNNEKLYDWTKKKLGINNGLNISEPQCFVEIMDRRKDWSVIVCLVGLGQDINDGEAGVFEWFRTVISDYTDWNIYYSPQIFDQKEDDRLIKDEIINCPRCYEVEGLHLNTSVRSFRSEKVSAFVDNVLGENPKEAKLIYNEINEKYPIYITRDIDKAKKFVRASVRGSQKCGVVASSSAQRLRPYGLYVPKDIDTENWFLSDNDDLRSSNSLEIVASEFKVQGLEIDFSIVCWDADLRKVNKGWEYYNFRGTKWNKRNQDVQKRYLVNAYRVLLTRARQGMVIFVPEGVDESVDKTRKHEFYDKTYEYLHNDCGINEL